jgi:YD repeat-containing protein
MVLRVNQSGSLGIFLLASVAFVISFALSYGWTQHNTPSVQSAASSVSPLGSDKEQAGLSGPVNRVRTETAKLFLRSGKLVEGERELFESTTYDPQGGRVDNSYFLVSSNAQTGKEEYAYDDRGNVSEMTLRDNNNNILGKEVYDYEYDAVGNWVKMLTSTVVYEEGRVSTRPTEVTYRTISYYFDQAVAELAESGSSTTDALSDEQRARADAASLRVALDGWIAATNGRDIESLMRFYNSKIEAFYRARDVAQDVVREDRARMFQRAEAIEVSVGDPEITTNPEDGTATMSFRKNYVIKVNGRERRGEVIQQLRWLRTEEGWKIVSERDVKVLR